MMSADSLAGSGEQQSLGAHAMRAPDLDENKDGASVSARPPFHSGTAEVDPLAGRRMLMCVAGPSTRGRARATVQLSKDQFTVLLWVWLEVIKRGKHRKNKHYFRCHEVINRPVPWHAKQCFSREELTPSRRAAISRCLKRLADRGLVRLLGPEGAETSGERNGRTARVELTLMGCGAIVNRGKERLERRKKNIIYGGRDD